MKAPDRAGGEPRPGGPRLTTRRDAPGRGEAQAKTVPEPAEIRRALARIAPEILERTNGGGGGGVARRPNPGRPPAPGPGARPSARPGPPPPPGARRNPPEPAR